MRRLLPALFALAACSGSDQATAPDPPGAHGEPVVECAVGGMTSFEPVCELEFAQQGERRLLVTWHPDGSFRRFVVLEDGRGVEEADGADQAEVSLVEGGIEVVVGTDRYRLPANIRGTSGE